VTAASVVSSHIVSCCGQDVAFGYWDAQLNEAHKTKPYISPIYPGLQPNMSSMGQTDATYGYDIFHTGVGNLSLVQALTQWRGSDHVLVSGAVCCSLSACIHRCMACRCAPVPRARTRRRGPTPG
jgi:hypothetical protein